VSPTPHLRTETDPVSEKCSFVFFRTPDNGQSKENSNADSLALFMMRKGHGRRSCILFRVLSKQILGVNKKNADPYTGWMVCSATTALTFWI
jgi:hypothetical protein